MEETALFPVLISQRLFLLLLFFKKIITTPSAWIIISISLWLSLPFPPRRNLKQISISRKHEPSPRAAVALTDGGGGREKGGMLPSL